MLQKQFSRGYRAGPFRLGELAVYPDRGLIAGPTQKRRLEPKLIELLLYLAGRPRKVVSRTELLDGVWKDAVVCDQSLTRCISELRKALGEVSLARGVTASDRSGRGQNYIETVPKRGYRLNSRPELIQSPGITPATISIADQPPLIERLLHADQDSLAVLPLQQFAGDKTQPFLGTGFARDVAALLSLAPGLSVVASSSVEHCAGLGEGPDAIAEKLGARYIVTGALETRGKAFRLRLELVDTKTSRQLWSNHYDEQISEFYVVQDRLAQQIARSLSSALAVGKVRDIQARGVFDLCCYEHIQLAEDARRNYNREAADYIVQNLSAVLDTQPDNGIAHAYLAMQLSQNVVSGWSDCARETSQRSAHHLHRALRCAPNDSRVLMAAGISALMQGQHVRATEYLERSLELNPNEAHALAEYGMARYYVTGELLPSMALIEQAEAAAPQHPRYSIWAYRRGICLYEAGDYLPALDALDQGITRAPNYYHTYMTKALLLIAIERPQQARAAIDAGRRHAPSATASGFLAGVRSFGLTFTPAQDEIFRSLWAPCEQGLQDAAQG